MCTPPFATKQRPPIWKILDPPLFDKKKIQKNKNNNTESIKQTSRELLVKTLNISYFFSSRLFVVYPQEGVQDSVRG